MPEPVAPDPKPEPCLWVRDLDDTTSEAGQRAVEQIRRQCPCNECQRIREEEHAAL